MARSSNGPGRSDGGSVPEYDRSNDGAVSERVVTAVADARDVDPLDLPPLYDVVDPDALDALFGDAGGRMQPNPHRVVFTMAGCDVVVDATGDVDVTGPDEQSATPSPAERAAERTGTETESE